MRFIIVLLSLALFRYLRIGLHFKRFDWFEGYLDKVAGYAIPYKLWKSYLAIACVVLPVFIVVLLIYVLFSPLFYHLVGQVISFVILVYCLDPDNRLVLFWEKEKSTQPDNNLLTAIFDGFFAPAFWFLILGPMATLLYRLISLTDTSLRSKRFEDDSLRSVSNYLVALIEWLPARVMSLGFAFMGHFIPTFDFWVRHVLINSYGNRHFLKDSAQMALTGLSATERDGNSSDSAIILLLERTFLFFIVLCAVIVIARLM
jgi:AmpE protein